MHDAAQDTTRNPNQQSTLQQFPSSHVPLALRKDAAHVACRIHVCELKVTEGISGAAPWYITR